MRKIIISGIYLITNVFNNKVYVGLSDNIFERWGNHRNSLKRNQHDNKHMQNSYNKYKHLGNVFTYKILEKCKVDELGKKEIYWGNYYINLLGKNMMYNEDGFGLVHLHTEETKRKIGLAHKGKIVSIETREKLRLSRLNKKRSLDVILKIKENHLNSKWMNNGIKENFVNKSNFEKYLNNNYKFGRLKMPEESKKKIKSTILQKYAKKVAQYDLNGNFIKEYESVKKASQETNIFACNISTCINGHQKTAGGFLWKII